MLALSALRADAMGGDHPTGTLAASAKDWPGGLLDLVNFDGRVHGHWVNANHEFFFRGDAAAFSNFVELYAKVRDTALTLTIHVDGARRSALWGEKPNTEYDWKLYIQRRGWDAPIDPNRPKDQPGYVVSMDVWVDKRVKLKQVRLPTDVDVKASGKAEPGGEIGQFVKAHRERQRAEEEHQPVPVAQVWNGGTGLAGIEPWLVFAAWADGTVVRRIDGKLRVGSVAPARIAELQADIRKGGFFQPPLQFGLVRPDGPELRIAAADGDARMVLSYEGGKPRLEDYGHDSSPSRQQVTDFVAMWDRVVAAMDRVQPGKWTDFDGERKLRFP